MKVPLFRTLSMALIAVGVLAAGAMRLKAADASTFVGTWDCSSETSAGDEFKFTLTIREQDGKLSATAESEQGTIPISAIELGEEGATFKASVNDQDFVVKIKVNGSEMNGTWSGGDDNGTLKGAKRA